MARILTALADEFETQLETRQLRQIDWHHRRPVCRHVPALDARRARSEIRLNAVVRPRLVLRAFERAPWEEKSACMRGRDRDEDRMLQTQLKALARLHYSKIVSRQVGRHCQT